MNPNTEQLIDNYLLGKLTLLQLAYVEKQLKTNADFEKEVNIRRAILWALENKKKAEFKQLLNKSEEKEIKIVAFKPKSNWLFYSVAASLLFIISFSVYIISFLSNPEAPTSKRGHIIITSQF